MRRIVVGTTTAALALTVAAISTPAQASPVQPAEPATPTVLRTVRVDVNGDGKTDTVTVTALGGTQYELKVVTAKATAAVTFSSTDPLESRSVWGGAARLDGVKGAELIVRTSTPDASGGFAVYTWRKGALVAEAAPASPSSRAGWWTGDAQAVRFFTSHGRAYVEVAKIASASTNGAHWVKIVRSVWRSGKWVKVSTRSVKLSAARMEHYSGIQAPSILLNQAKVDMDGDGKLDTVSYRLLAGERTQTKIVTAKGKVITRTIHNQDFGGAPLIAGIDGVPGSELAYVDGDGYTWKVLSLRKGKLVVVRSPEGNTTWTRSPEGWSESYDLYASEDEDWKVNTRAYGGDTEPYTVYWARYVWISGKWVKQAAWTTTASEAEAGAFCHGFCGGITLTQL
jgi:hypothetical protein